jgi:hypothetical protein
MAYTFRNPSLDLKLRLKSKDETEAAKTNLSDECGIRLEHWHELRRTILYALLPHGQAHTAVIEAIEKLQHRLGLKL